MPNFCITIHGVQHCFGVPLLVDRLQIKPPPPDNYPPFDLALTVQELLKVIRPLAPNSPFVKELDEMSRGFIREVVAGLPKGVELSYEEAVQEQTAV